MFLEYCQWEHDEVRRKADDAKMYGSSFLEDYERFLDMHSTEWGKLKSESCPSASTSSAEPKSKKEEQEGEEEHCLFELWALGPFSACLRKAAVQAHDANNFYFADSDLKDMLKGKGLREKVRNLIYFL